MYYKGGCGVVPPAGVVPLIRLSRQDDCKIPRVATWHGHVHVSVTEHPIKKDLLNFSKSLDSYWVRESNPYCKIENLEY